MSKGSAQLSVESENREAFAKRVSEFTSIRGNLALASRETGASKAAISNWAKGETEPSRDYLVALANVMGVTVEWLATGKGPKGCDETRHQITYEAQEGEADTMLPLIDSMPAIYVFQAMEGLNRWLEEENCYIEDHNFYREVVKMWAEDHFKADLENNQSPLDSKGFEPDTRMLKLVVNK